MPSNEAGRSLTEAQKDAFWRDGYLLVEEAVTPAQLEAMRGDLSGWVEESRSHEEPFGTPTIDGRPRFDMGTEHRPDNPALRRVNNPSDISGAYEDVIANAPVVDMIADLIGPDVKFHQFETAGLRDGRRLPPGLRLHTAHERRHHHDTHHAGRYDGREWVPYGGSRQS